MLTLQKTGKDFRILNLSDIQLNDREWTEPEFRTRLDIFRRTLETLVERVHPSLITITGDLSWAGEYTAYRMLAEFLDSFGILWAPVWGNHDQQAGLDILKPVVEEYRKHPLCLYESGDPALGEGNYVIAIEEDGRIVEGLIMMDSHDSTTWIDPEGSEKRVWAKLYPQQLDWYKEQVSMLRDKGCTDTTLMLHIPIYGYKTAYLAALPEDADPKDPLAGGRGLWRSEYADTQGVLLEDVGCYPEDEGALDAIAELGSTRHVVCGHDHVNNLIVRCRGVKLIYSMKTGPGCYWTPILNGGTVLTVTDHGISSVYHEYVDAAFPQK